MKTIHISVGVNKYGPAYGTGSDLAQCVFDRDRMAKIAKAETCLKYEDGNATFSNISQQIRAIAATAMPGERLYFSMSSHGTYTIQNGKIVTALCFHDRPVFDFEMRELWALFPKGYEIVTFSDCCHAHSNQRLPSEPGARRRSVELDSTVFPSMPATQGKPPKATLVNFSACGPNQVAFEFSSGGLFTSAIEVAHGMSPGVTFAELISAIRPVCQRKAFGQTPTVQKSGTNAAFFNSPIFFQ